MRLHLVGGFLGSGKTTAIVGAARVLAARGLKVGVVTNDQGKALVDSAFFQAAKVPAVEVTGGCFCCNYDDLTTRLEQLQGAAAPDVIFAESVGSCADLVATVLKPLLQLAQGYAPSSFSVFADCRLLRRRLRGEPLPFSDEVVYIFDQQIEEAGLLVVNKADLLTPAALDELRGLVARRWADKPVLFHSAVVSLTPGGVSQELAVPLSTKTATPVVGAGEGPDTGTEMLRSAQHDKKMVEVGDWLATIEGGAVPLPGSALQIDYARYGAGEARLAWLDLQVTLVCREGDGKNVLLRLLEGILAGLSARGAGLGHLKLMVAGFKISLTGLDDPDWREQVPALNSGRLQVLLNARAELPPQALLALVEASLAECGAETTVERVDSFAPAFPDPRYRYED